ncbi:MAG: hypothetical protein ACTSQO_00180 [Candidatus Helarchaeota archaeon]
MTEKNVDLEKIYDKVLGFIKDLNPPTIEEHRDKYQIISPFKYEFPDKKVINFLVDTRIGSKWIETKCLLLFKKSISDMLEIEPILHKKILEANFNYAEITFSIDNEGNIYAEADQPLDTDFANFKSEYGSIVFAIDLFFNKIIPSISNEIKKVDTYNSPIYT